VDGFANPIARGKRVHLETSYFYPLLSPNANFLGDGLFLSLHFVIGVCKQQQIPSQFAKAFGDILTLNEINPISSAP
jgi:hypothetical protein